MVRNNRNIVKSISIGFRKFFVSIRVALFLIGFLTFLSLVGLLLIQAPDEIRRNAVEYSWWLDNVAYEKTGVLTGTLALLQFFNIFTSSWFIGGCFLLIISILFCMYNRLKSSIRLVTQKTIRKGITFYDSMPVHSVLMSIEAPDHTSTSLSGVLKKHRYRTVIEKSGDSTYLAADKNRFAPFGTYLSHLGIIVLILGAMVGSFTGFRNTSFIISEGENRDVGFDTGLSLYLDSFRDEYWKNGSPKDYRSNVVLYKNTNEVRRSTIRVNHPLNYDGIRFYQSFFGLAAQIQVKDKRGSELYHGAVPLTQQAEMNGRLYSVGMIRIPGTLLALHIIGPAQRHTESSSSTERLAVHIYQSNSSGPVSMGFLQQGETLRFSALNITNLGLKRFSGFEIKRDPGTWLIWLASFLFILGTTMVSYFPFRSVRAIVQNESPGSRLIIGMSSRQRDAEAELKSILADFGQHNVMSLRRL